MEPIERVTGVAAPLLVDDVNTDQIAPTSAHVGLHPDYAAMLFANWRASAGNAGDPFVLDRPEFAECAILVVGHNFGCGSSRESAVWAMTARGIRCIVARSFSDIYRENCLRNVVVPVVLAESEGPAFEAAVVGDAGADSFDVDLRTQRITCPDGRAFEFELQPAERKALMSGSDDIALTLEQLASIEAWERRMRARHRWLQAAPTPVPNQPATGGETRWT